jgi:hypothetical protein
MRLIDYPTQTCTSTENMLSWQANGMRWKGGWLASTAYSANDVVRYNGSTYVAKLANTNVVPTNVTYWAVMALRRSRDVPPGSPGARSPGAPVPQDPRARRPSRQLRRRSSAASSTDPISASFVAAADGSCLVTTSVAPFLTTLPAPPAGQTVALVGGGVSVNGAPYVTDNTGGLWSTGVGGAYSTSDSHVDFTIAPVRPISSALGTTRARPMANSRSRSRLRLLLTERRLPILQALQHTRRESSR